MFVGPQIRSGCQSQRTLGHSPGNLPGSPETLCRGRRVRDRESCGPPARSRLPFHLPSPTLGAGSFLSLTTLPSLHASLPSPPASISSPLCPPARLSLRAPVIPLLTSSSLSILPPCLCSPLLPSLLPSSPSSIHPSTHPPMDLFLRPLACPSFLPCIHLSATPPTHSSIIHPFINTCNQSTLPATLSVKHWLDKPCAPGPVLETGAVTEIRT